MIDETAPDVQCRANLADCQGVGEKSVQSGKVKKTCQAFFDIISLNSYENY